ncbi:MAG: hypothetical protein ACYS9X_18890 [Planctomycetota bacterium]|jgi:hypothetical protein
MLKAADHFLDRALARGALAAVALAAVSCAGRMGEGSPAPRRLPSARTPRPVIALSRERGEVRVTTASWLPSGDLFGRFEDPREAVARIEDGALALEGPGAVAPRVAPPQGADPVGPWCDSEVRSGSVENDLYDLSWVSHGPVKSKLRFKTPHGALSATYADVAYRRGGATPGRFLLAGGLAIRNKTSGRTWHYLRGRGPASLERAIADAKDLVAATRRFPSNRVSSVWLSRGEAWVGTFDAGLCRVDIATGGVARPRAGELMPKGISTLLKVGDLVFAGSFRRGLWMLDAPAGIARRVDGVLGVRVNCILLVGDLLWVGTDDGVSDLSVSRLARPAGGTLAAATR